MSGDKKKNMRNRRGQARGVMTLILLVVLIIGVGIPITNEVIADGNLTGLTSTVVSFVPVFLALVVLFGAAAFISQ